jgi:septal ring factor EnvC (AmiA/AmiB activator)
MSGPPLSVQHLSGAPADAAGPGRLRGAAIPLLAGTSALLLVVTVVLAALLVGSARDLRSTRTDLAATQQQADAQRQQLATKDRTIEGLRGDVTAAKDDLAATQQELTGTKNRLGDTEADKKVVSDCLKLILQFFDAAGKGDEATARSVLEQANQPCQAADKVANG